MGGEQLGLEDWSRHEGSLSRAMELLSLCLSQVRLQEWTHPLSAQKVTRSASLRKKAGFEIVEAHAVRFSHTCLIRASM